MSIKMIHHICIQTEKYEESLDFYTRILGFEMINETPNFHGRDFNTWVKLDNFMIELQTPKEGEKFNKWSSLNAGPVHMAFMVANVEQEYERIISLGYI
ncbi:VOC family protein, partial [Clostridium perfringens]|uniref:VOC family protein n=1 Tax=Clostridium perfringens TaxID=1502 RepID=UPI002ACEEC6E